MYLSTDLLCENIYVSLRRITGIGLLVLTISGSRVFSQSVREISTKDGLPQSFVSGLVQDDTSFIWIGTRNGLSRYDGVHFKVFQHNSRDSASLASNLIIYLRKEKPNQLWMEYESGEIDRMDPVTEKITHILKGNLSSGKTVQFIRRGWFADESGLFWGIIEGKGFNVYNLENKNLSVFSSKNSALPCDTVRGMVETRNHSTWILSQRGISLFDFKTRQFRNWTLPFKQNYGDFGGVNAITIDLHERNSGELMWGDRQRLFFFNPVTRSFRTLSLPDLAYLGIRWIRTGNDGVEYFENYGKVYRYDDSNGVRSIGKTITESFGDVKSFLVDRSGLIWLGTNAGGIHQIDLETPFFQSFKYSNDFLSDLLRQEYGVNIRAMFYWDTIDNIFSKPGYHLRSVYDVNKRLYLALKETVCYVDQHQNKIIRLPRVPLIGNGEKLRVAIKGITVLSNGSPTVIGYNGHVMSYDFSVQAWRTLLDSSSLRKLLGYSFLPLDILADDRNLWITTQSDGLLKVDIETKKVTQYKEGQSPGSLPSNQLLGIKTDPSDSEKIWIGSYQGLISMNKKTGKSELISVKEGLPDNTIYAIQPDASGNFWLGTNKGICRFNPSTRSIRAFHTEHGLPGDEFNRFHNLELPDGRFTFGGTDGWTIFNPLLIKNDEFKPAIAFTDIRINNSEVQHFKEKEALFLPINALSQLSLPYTQNTISIGFAGLEFSQPQDLKYRYKLEGYDNDWVMADNQHQVIYTKIPPGNYRLMVNASNTSGAWSDHIRTLKLRIESPWWATLLAYICYCIILIGLAYTIIRLRVSRILLKQEMLLKVKETVQLKEIDDMKSRFFSNITHEFRTPLTLIMGPAEQLRNSANGDPQLNRLTDTILNNATQMLVLINRLMDLSKLEAKALRLNEQRCTPADVVGSIIHSFQNDAEFRKVQLEFIDRESPRDCWIYADALERIVYNLVSNALKFTGPGGKVEVQLSIKDKKLLLEIRDNGMGISPDKLPHIFDRFYQAGGNAGLVNEELTGGTGIGLALVKELVQQMHANIDVESSVVSTEHVSRGTLFTLYMPFRVYEELDANESDLEGKTEIPELSGKETNMLPKILLVEDNLELAGFISGILSCQYDVEHVINGSAGLESAITLMPDLIISDVMMPVMDGYEMCGHLKEDIRSSHIPVILLTAKVSWENLIEGLSKGADDYLTKPFYPTELLLRIHNLLDRQRKLRDRIQEELALPSGPGLKETVPQDIFITRLQDILDEHLDDDLFGVDQLTDLVHMSRSSLHRKLKALSNMTTTEFVRNYRLKKATRFLLEGYSSSDTAYKTGFGSPAYFTKSFREVYGITPGDYVKTHKKV